MRSHLDPIVKEWAGSFLLDISPSGSFAKGTANKSGTDVDLFIPLSPNTKETLKEIYDKLFDRMQQKGLNPGRQNVSIKVEVNGYSVDLVPGKRHNLFGLDDSLYRRRADTWTKTNVTTHIAHIKAGGRTQETRIVKLWRDQKKHDFPSFYLELAVLRAFAAAGRGTLATNVRTVFDFLGNGFADARIVDPANTNNIVSDELIAAERAKIVTAAKRALSASTWQQIVV
ncbi:MAG: nucleotidyltransferase domain-containing protein [Acidobacteriaceae bacterium]|nr:nucleotidyltransferase domain-containing protein [Acidobacteriaceae bacterium]